MIFAVRDEIKTWQVDKKSKAGEWVITDPGIDDKRIFVLTEELSSALQAMAREGNTLSSIVRQIFDSGNLEPLTKSSKIKATGAHIGVVGHITIFELNQLLKENEIHNGLINRFLWFCARRQKVIPFPEPIPDNDLIVFQSEIRDIVFFANRTESISFSADGREIWGEFYPELSESKGGFIGAVLERAPALVLRMAMLFCLIDRTNRISEEQLKTAIMLWRYCEQSARYIFGDKEIKNPLSKKILDMLSEKPLSMSEIYKGLSSHTESASIQITVKALIERNKVCVSTIKTNGRPCTIYSIVN